MSSHTSIFFAGHTLAPPRHVYRGKAMPLYTGGLNAHACQRQRTTSCLVSQTLSFSVPPPLDDIRTPARVCSRSSETSIFSLISDWHVSEGERNRHIWFFLDVSHSDNPQPAAANTAHNARHHALGKQIREGNLLLPSSGLRGNCNLLLLTIHDKPVV